jgi:hypothetical protein
MHVTAPEPSLTVYFINPSHLSVCVSLLSLLGTGSVNTIQWQRIHATIEELLGRVCLWVFLCISLLLLGNASVKTIPRQRRIVARIVFYAACVVRKEFTIK